MASTEIERGKLSIHSRQFFKSFVPVPTLLPDQICGSDPIPRIARLMALAIRFEGLVREKKVRDYAELSRRGRVTRARMTQIMKLRHLASDIQEQILFLPPIIGLNERNLRCVVRCIDWSEQRRMFQKFASKESRSTPALSVMPPTQLS